MKKLDKLDKNIRPYLLKIGYEKWTSNIAESMNSTNKAAKDLPVVTLV